MSARRPRGRRGAGVDTRAEIVDAATRLFVEHGFERTSLRAIAREAQVDAALVHHYFDSKPELFMEALRPVPPRDARLRTLHEGPIDNLGERLARTFVTLWDHPELGRRLRVILVTAATTPEVASAMEGLLVGEVLTQMAATTGKADADMRVAACASQLIGLAITRYILEFEPVASASPDQVVQLVAPTLQRYLTGDIDTA